MASQADDKDGDALDATNAITPAPHPLERAKALADLGGKAAEQARQQLMQHLEEFGVNTQSLAIVANDLLLATKQKVQWSKENGRFEYSKHLSDNITRYNTLKLLLEFWDVMPSKKVDINDSRQTRELAAELFKKMDQARMLGNADTQPVMDEQEKELMGDMLEMRQNEDGEFEPDKEGE